MASAPTLNTLRSSLTCQVLMPDDPLYDEARKIHNAMIDKRPSMIVRCSTTQDVSAAVKFARENNLRVSVRGAGHNVAGICIADDAMLIDLSAMKQMHIDSEAHTATAEAGVTWAELNNELQPFGLAATGGYVGTT